MSEWQTSPRVCRWCKAHFVRPPGWPWVCPTPACLARCTAFGIQIGDAWRYLPLPLQAEMMAAHVPQTAAKDTTTNVLVAGAAGASKSHGVRWGAYWWAMRVPGCRILLLREVSDELRRSHILGLMDVEAEELGAHFVSHPYPMARWPSGSFIEGGHMEDRESVKRYLSSEYDLIIAEEATLYDPDALAELITRARTSNDVMKAHGGARVWLPTNPGGPSTELLRTLFLDKEIDADEWPQMAEHYRPEEWIHVPGTLDDNPYLDPAYERRLAILRQSWRYQQLRHGDWYATPGLFFDAFAPSVHVVDRTIPSPGEQTWFRSLDWGYHDPGVMLWWVVLEDQHLHVAAELKFQGATPEELAPRIHRIDRELGTPPTLTTWASPDMWAKRGQIGETLQETARRNGWPVRMAHTDRENGWMRLHTLLRPDATGTPWLTMASRCRYLIRSFQTAQSDEHHPNDVRQQDDHALEAARYGAMSRPLARGARRGAPPRRTFEDDFTPPARADVGVTTRL